MKKILVVSGLVTLLLCGCSSNDNSSDYYYPTEKESSSLSAVDGVITIKEKMFMTQVFDLLTNVEDYVGKTVQLEGFVDTYMDVTTGNTYYSVVRYGPGCCLTDGTVGLEINWDKAYPGKNQWVRATGVVELYEEAEETYVRLALESLEELEERGMETVYQ